MNTDRIAHMMRCSAYENFHSRLNIIYATFFGLSTMNSAGIVNFSLSIDHPGELYRLNFWPYHPKIEAGREKGRMDHRQEKEEVW